MSYRYHEEGSWYQHYLFDVVDMTVQSLCSELTAYTRIVKYVLTNLFVGKMPQPIRYGVCQGTDGSCGGSSLAFSSPLSIQKEKKKKKRTNQTKTLLQPKRLYASETGIKEEVRS